MGNLFLYGTLCHLPLLALVLGKEEAEVDTVPASLPDHAVFWAEHQAFPLIQTQSGGLAQGILLRDLSAEDIERLNYYEGGFAYDLRAVEVRTAGASAPAQVYFPQEGVWETGDPWDLHDWEARWGAVSMGAAQEVMARYGRASAQDMQKLLPFFRARAWSVELARQAAPQTVRSRQTSADVELVSDRPGFDGFFRVKAFTARHKLFNGGVSPDLERETFMSFDVSLVLPYDPVNDTVLLIEQVRLGAFNRGDPAPWVLEPVAGLVDAGETPQDAARRETIEEANLKLDALIDMTQVYPSPGYSTEFFHCYLGLCDLGGRGLQQGGLADEHEDIRSHVIPFDRAMELVDSGEVNTAPLAMMLLWLFRRRPELRSMA